MYSKKLSFLLIIIIIIFTFNHVYAVDMTSSNFIIRDPLVGTGGSFGTSASFKAYGSGDITNIGRATSASYETRYGFLWYPYITKGILTVVPNVSQADLSWTNSGAGLGWNVTGYNTGISSTPGGPYTYTNVGLVNSYSYTGLNPGQYCFVLQTYEGTNSVIATSAEQCISIVPTLTFSVSDSSVAFGNLSSVIARYADTSSGTSTNAVAHTMTASSNASTGYTLTYKGQTLTSGSNTLSPATITNSTTGTPGTSQFALSLSSSGSAGIVSDYNQNSGSGNWKFISNSTESLVTTSGITTSETFSNRYISNIAASQQAGNYSTVITYVITGNF